VIQSAFLDPACKVHGQLDRKDLTKVLEAGEGILWVDISGRDLNDEEVLRDTFRFHPLAIEDCFDDRIDTAKVDDYEDYIFLVAPYAEYDPATGQVNIRELCVFVGHSYVVSVHQRPIQPVHDLFERASREARILDRGADFLAHGLLDAIVDELAPAVDAMDEQLDALQQAVLDSPQRSQLSSILVLKRNALRLRRSVESQRDMVNRLARGEFPGQIRPESAIFFRDVYDHIIRAETLIEGVRDLADAAMSYYLSALNNRMNEIMKVLSVVAVIFLPLTLIASIFGTNLDYSLELGGGFFVMLAAMLLIAAAMILYFRKRGWF
jgi:magnesium transporter